jgi:hypothetical protein
LSWTLTTPLFDPNNPCTVIKYEIILLDSFIDHKNNDHEVGQSRIFFKNHFYSLYNRLLMYTYILLVHLIFQGCHRSWSHVARWRRRNVIVANRAKELIIQFLLLAHNVD